MVTPGTALSFKWNAVKAVSGANLQEFAISQGGSNTISPLPMTANGETLPITNLPNKYNDQYVDTISFNAGMNV